MAEPEVSGMPLIETGCFLKVLPAALVRFPFVRIALLCTVLLSAGLPFQAMALVRHPHWNHLRVIVQAVVLREEQAARCSNFHGVVVVHSMKGLVFCRWFLPAFLLHAIHAFCPVSC